MDKVKEDANTSLYDYLGYAAGKQLGDEVYKASIIAKEPVNIREAVNVIKTFLNK